MYPASKTNYMRYIYALLILLSVVLAAQFFFSCSSARPTSREPHNTLTIAQQGPPREEVMGVPNAADEHLPDIPTDNPPFMTMAAPGMLDDITPGNQPERVTTPDMKPPLKKKPAYLLRLADGEPEKKMNTMALLSFVFAIAGVLLFLVLALTPFPLGFAPLTLVVTSIVLGFMGLSEIKKNPEKYKGKGLAIAGIVISFAGLFIFIAFVILVLFLVFFFFM